MFLLRLATHSDEIIIPLAFTLQYVSIKTQYEDLNFSEIVLFTFQYVSIKTPFAILYAALYKSFTFQYVSIKTT